MQQTYSASSVGTYLGCPYAFKLNYIDGLRSETNQLVKDGQWIHKKIEDWVCGTYNVDSVSDKYIDALKEWLKDENDEITESEKKIKFEVNGFPFVSIIDAFTQNGKAIDFKVTGAAGFYSNFHSYQARLYTYALRKLGLDYDFVYVFLNRKKTVISFDSLSVDYPTITDIENEETEDFITHWVKKIEEAKKTKCFPPSYSGCGKCFWKKHCYYYWGY